MVTQHYFSRFTFRKICANKIDNFLVKLEKMAGNSDLDIRFQAITEDDLFCDYNFQQYIFYCFFYLSHVHICQIKSETTIANFTQTSRMTHNTLHKYTFRFLPKSCVFVPSFVYCKTHSKADLRADGMIYYPNRIAQLKVHSHGATKIATKSIFTNRKGMYCFQKRLSVILSRGRGSASGGGESASRGSGGSASGGLPPGWSAYVGGLHMGVCFQGVWLQVSASGRGSASREGVCPTLPQ